MQDFNSSLDTVVSALGLQGIALLVVLIVVSLVCRLVTKLIPDDRKGLLGFVRVATGVIGLYAENRISGGCTTTDAIQQVGRVATRAISKANAVQEALPAIPVRDPATGQFQAKTSSPIAVGLLALGLALMLCGCTPAQLQRTDSIVTAVCYDAQTAQRVLDTVRADQTPGALQRFLVQVNDSCPAVLFVLNLTAAERALAQPNQ